MPNGVISGTVILNYTVTGIGQRAGLRPFQKAVSYFFA